MAVCSEIHTKHINTLCGQNVELLNVKLAVRKLNEIKFKGLIQRELIPTKILSIKKFHYGTIPNFKEILQILLGLKHAEERR